MNCFLVQLFASVRQSSSQIWWSFCNSGLWRESWGSVLFTFSHDTLVYPPSLHITRITVQDTVPGHSFLKTSPDIPHSTHTSSHRSQMLLSEFVNKENNPALWAVDCKLHEGIKVVLVLSLGPTSMSGNILHVQYILLNLLNFAHTEVVFTMRCFCSTLRISKLVEFRFPVTIEGFGSSDEYRIGVVGCV